MDSKRSTSRSRSLSRSRPTTPLRPSSRSSFHSQPTTPGGTSTQTPLETLEPAFAELSDSMADLEANFMHLQLMHESLSRFSENFAAFLYGLNMNAFCVDFPEAPITDSFKRAAAKLAEESSLSQSTDSEPGKRVPDIHDAETTFMTTDTSFVDNPPATTSSRTNRFSTPAPSSRGKGTTAGRGRGAGSGRGIRGSGLARARARYGGKRMMS